MVKRHSRTPKESSIGKRILIVAALGIILLGSQTSCKGVIDNPGGKSANGAICGACEDFPLECIEANRCGPDNLRQYIVVKGWCKGTRTCGFGDYKTRPNACMCCRDNQIRKGGFRSGGYCEDCPVNEMGDNTTNTCKCVAPNKKCNGVCTNLIDDVNNCGGCNNKCTDGKQCCNGNCINLTIDNNNCGSCGNLCSGNQVCDSGRCVGNGEIP